MPVSSFTVTATVSGTMIRGTIAQRQVTIDLGPLEEYQEQELVVLAADTGKVVSISEVAAPELLFIVSDQDIQLTLADGSGAGNTYVLAKDTPYIFPARGVSAGANSAVVSMTFEGNSAAPISGAPGEDANVYFVAVGQNAYV